MNGRCLRCTGVLVLSLFLITGCGISYIRGSGNVITEEREVSGFDSVDMSGFGEIFITQGDTESLTIETDDNLMQYIKSEVRGNTLYLEFEENTIPNPSSKITFRLNVVDLAALDLAGAGSFNIESLETPSLEITFSGAGDIDLNSLVADRVSTRISGAGDVSVSGEVGIQNIHIEGAGKYSAPDLKSSEATVQIEGLGNVVIWVIDALDLTIDGAGNVDYYGNPTVSQSIEGGGSINSLGAK
jgi:hypothetical protein